MTEFNDKTKAELTEQMGFIDHDYNDIALIKVYHQISAFIKLGHFIEVESWLLELQKEMPIAKGVLALIYVDLEDWENAQQYAAECTEKFKGTKIWSDIIQTSIWRGFKETRDTPPA